MAEMGKDNKQNSLLGITLYKMFPCGKFLPNSIQSKT